MKKHFQKMVRSRLEKKIKAQQAKGLRIEPLEDRMLLSATPNDWDPIDETNIGLETFTGNIANTTYPADLILKVENTDREVVLGLLVHGEDDPTTDDFDPLDPAAIVIGKADDLDANASFEIIKRISDYNGTGDSLLLVKVAPSESGYKLTIRGENNGETGGFSCCVFTPGSTNDNGIIDPEEVQDTFKYITYTNAYLSGNRNPAAIDIYRHMFGENVDLSRWDNVYNADYDINMDGMMSSEDLSLIKLGITSTDVNVSLQWADKIEPTVEWPVDPGTETPTVTSDEVTDIKLDDNISVASAVFDDGNGHTASAILGPQNPTPNGVERGVAGFPDGQTLGEALGLTENGVYDLTLTVTDAAGNKSVNPFTFVYLNDKIEEKSAPDNVTTLESAWLFGTDPISSVSITEGENAAKNFDASTLAWNNGIATETLASGAIVTFYGSGAGITSIEYATKGRWDQPKNLADGVHEKVSIAVTSAAASPETYLWQFDVIGVNDAPESDGDVAISIEKDTDESGASPSKVTDRDQGATLSYAQNVDVPPTVVFQKWDADNDEWVEDSAYNAIIPDGTDFTQMIAYSESNGYEFTNREFFRKLPKDVRAIVTYNYKVNDGQWASVSEKVIVTITGENASPEGSQIVISGDADTEFYLLSPTTSDVHDVDYGDTFKFSGIVVDGKTYEIVEGTGGYEFKNGENPALAAIGVSFDYDESGTAKAVGTYSLDANGKVRYTLDAAYAEWLKWNTVKDETFDLANGGLQYIVADSQNAESVPAGVIFNYTGAFDKLANLDAPNQEVNALDTTNDTPLKQATFTSDKAQENYTFTIEAIELKTDAAKTLDLNLIKIGTVVYGQNGSVQLSVDKEVLAAIDEADYGIYTVTLAYENNENVLDFGSTTFDLNVIGYTLTFAPDSFGAGSLTEDTVYDADDDATQLAGNIKSEITTITVEAPGKADQTATSYDVMTDGVKLTVSGSARTFTGEELAALKGLLKITNASGDYTFDFNAAQSGLFDYLKPSETLTLTYQYKVTNVVTASGAITGTFDGGFITVDITGVNDAPAGNFEHIGTIDLAQSAPAPFNVITGFVTDAEGDDLSASGTGVDVYSTYTEETKTTDDRFYTGGVCNVTCGADNTFDITVASDGTVTVNPSLWTKLAAMGKDETVTLVLDYAVSDGIASTNGKIVYTVTGVNDAPVWDSTKDYNYNVEEDTWFVLKIADLVSGGKLNDVDTGDNETLQFGKFDGIWIAAGSTVDKTASKGWKADLSPDGKTLSVVFNSFKLKWTDEATFEAGITVVDLFDSEGNVLSESLAQTFTFNAAGDYDEPEIVAPTDPKLSVSIATEQSVTYAGYVNIGGTEVKTNDCAWGISGWKIAGNSVSEEEFNKYFELVAAGREENGITFIDGNASIRFRTANAPLGGNDGGATAREAFAAAYLADDNSVAVSFDLTLTDENSATHSTTENVSFDVLKKAPPVIHPELIPALETGEKTTLTTEANLGAASGLVTDAGDLGTRTGDWYEFVVEEGIFTYEMLLNGDDEAALALFGNIYQWIDDNIVSITADGKFTLDLDADPFDKLAKDDVLTLTFEFTVRDKVYGVTSMAMFSVIVNGVNDAPVASDFTVDVTAGTSDNPVDWKGHVADPDRADTKTLAHLNVENTSYTTSETEYQTIQITTGVLNKDTTAEKTVSAAAGELGFLTLKTDGTVTFTATGKYLKWKLADGETFTFDFDYSMFDSDNKSSNATVTVNVAGVYDAITFTAEQEFDSYTNRAADTADGYVKIGTLDYTADKGTDLSAFTFDPAMLHEAGDVKVELEGTTFVIYAKKDSVDAVTGEHTLSFDYTDNDATNPDAGTVSVTLDVTAKTAPTTTPVAKPITEDTTGAITVDLSDLTAAGIGLVDNTQGEVSAVVTDGATPAYVDYAGTFTPTTAESNQFAGLVTITDGKLIFTNDTALFNRMNAGETLTLNYTYTLKGYTSDSVDYVQDITGTFSVTITGVNDAPTGVSDHTATLDLADGALSNVDGEQAKTELNVKTGVTDPENDSLVAVIISASAETGFSSTGLAQCFTISPNGVFMVAGEQLTTLQEIFAKIANDVSETNAVTITYAVYDGPADSTTTNKIEKTITLAVTGINDAPVAKTYNAGSVNSSASKMEIQLAEAGYATDVDGNLDTSKIYVRTATGVEDTYTLVERGANAVTLADGATVKIEQKSGVDYLVYTFTNAQIGLTAADTPENVAISFKAVDTLSAQSIDAAMISFVINGDYEKPVFIGSLGTQAGSLGTGSLANTVTLDLADTNAAGYFVGNGLTYAVTGVTGTGEFLDTSYGGGKGYVISGSTLTFYIIPQDSYDKGLDLSGLQIEVTATDALGFDADTTFGLTLEEQYTVTVQMKAVASLTTANTSTETTTQVKEAKGGGWGNWLYVAEGYDFGADMDALDSAVQNSGAYYVEVWIKDTAFTITGDKRLSGQIAFELDFPTANSSINSIFTPTACGSNGSQSGGGNTYISTDDGYDTVSEYYYDDDGSGHMRFRMFWNQNVTSFPTNLGILVDGDHYYRAGYVMVTTSELTAMSMSPIEKASVDDGLGLELGWDYSRTGLSDFVDESQIRTRGEIAVPTPITGLSQVEMAVNGGVYVRTVGEKTASQNVSALGDNDVFFHEWQSHYAELWIKASEAERYSSALLTLDYDSDVFSLVDVEFGSAFADGNYVADAQNGYVGVSAVSSEGVSGDGYILLARMKFESGEGQGIAWNESLAPQTLNVSITDALVTLDNGEVKETYIGKASTTELWANPYDADDNGVINALDFTYFASVFGQSASSSNLMTLFVDFDRNGVVNSLDYTYFAAFFGVSKQMVVSGAREIAFPKSFTQRYIGSTLNADNTALVGKVFDAASGAWAKALGLDEAASVTLIVKDLGGDTLAQAQVTQVDENGAATAGIIYLDDDAAGNYWYSQMAAPVDASRYDLYTVLLHELGHLYGYDASSDAYLAAMENCDYLDSDGHSTDSADVMYYGIEVGERKELTANDINAAATILTTLSGGEIAGSLLGASSAIVALGTAAGANVSETAGVDLAVDSLETVVMTRLTDSPLEPLALVIDSKSDKSLADSGLEIDGLIVCDFDAPLLVRDQILAETFADEEEDDEEDMLDFVNGEASDSAVSTELDAWFENGGLV